MVVSDAAASNEGTATTAAITTVPTTVAPPPKKTFAMKSFEEIMAEKKAKAEAVEREAADRELTEAERTAKVPPIDVSASFDCRLRIPLSMCNGAYPIKRWRSHEHTVV